MNKRDKKELDWVIKNYDNWWPPFAGWKINIKDKDFRRFGPKKRLSVLELFLCRPRKEFGEGEFCNRNIVLPVYTPFELEEMLFSMVILENDRCKKVLSAYKTMLRDFQRYQRFLVKEIRHNIEVVNKIRMKLNMKRSVSLDDKRIG